MFKSIIKYFFPTVIVVEEKVVSVEVLSRNAFNRLKGQLEQPIISGSDDPTNAAYKLGIQRALSVLEKGFVQ